MTVSEKDIARVLVSDEWRTAWAAYHSLNYVHPEVVERVKRDMVRAAATVLIPEGSVVIGGTCKGCIHFEDLSDQPGGGGLCHSPANPNSWAYPDFGCVHFLPPQETNG